MAKLPPMPELLRVDTAGVQAMAARWGASVGELNKAVPPSGLSLSYQASAAAVVAAHADIAAFTAALSTRVGARANMFAKPTRATSPTKLTRPTR